MSLTSLIVAVIRRYQRVASHALRASCRFEPSCSEYVVTAVQKYKPFLGIWKGVRRVLRCRRPYGGLDYP